MVYFLAGTLNQNLGLDVLGLLRAYKIEKNRPKRAVWITFTSGKIGSKHLRFGRPPFLNFVLPKRILLRPTKD